MSLEGSGNPNMVALKGSSNDMAWEWGERRDPTNNQKVWCTLCNKKMSGGIHRLKEHLSHTPGNVTGCTMVSLEIKKKVKEAMQQVRKKKVEKARVQHILERQDVDVSDDQLEEQHIFGGDGSDRNQCIVIGQGTKKRKGVDNVRGPLDLLMKVDAKKMKQSTLDRNDPHKQALKKVAWKKFAKWGYEVGLPFNAVRTPSFVEMIHTIGDYGRAMSPPSYYHYRVILLKEVYDDTRVFVNSFRKHWEMYGCSIMADFWTDGKQRSLINFLVNCPKGTIYLKSIDASEHVKDANLIVEMINDVIVEVGETNIVAFVTDNGSNFKLAGRLLEEEHPKMFWTPCAAHCINLMLGDIGKELAQVKSALSDAKSVVIYIYNHGRVLNMLRKLTGSKELHRSCITRFATSFYTLLSMWENRHHVQVLFVSERWKNSCFSKTLDGKNAARIVGRTTFWDRVYFTCQVMAPLVDVLRLVDREEKPCMGYIYEAMDRAKEQIQKNLGDDRRTCTKMWNIIDKRWIDQLHRPLHAEIETNTNIKSGLFAAMERLIPDSEIEKAMDDLRHYRDASGTFGIKSAISRRDKMQPYEWWLQFGNDTPELAKFAIKVLSQTCSASPCERNWSVFDHLHSKRRNCLQQSKLNDLVYIQYNQKLEKRFKERLAKPDSDPIVLKEVDENDDWIVPNEAQLADFVMEGDDLTWEQVQETRRVEDIAGPSTRSRTRSSTRLYDDEENTDVGGGEPRHDLESLDTDDYDVDIEVTNGS